MQHLRCSESNMSCNSAKNNFKSWETPTSLTCPSPCTSGLHSGMRQISSRGWYLGQVKHNTAIMVKCPTLPKQTKKTSSGSWRVCVPGDGVTARDAFHQSHTLLFFLLEAGVDFCCTGSIIALSDIWHIHSCWWSTGPNTNWHAKSQRKQGELSPVWGLLFNISFVMQPKEQLGIWGREPSQTAPSQQVQIAKREAFGKVTHKQTKHEKCYCKTSGVGVRHATQPGPFYWPLTFLLSTGQTQTTGPQQWAIQPML